MREEKPKIFWVIGVIDHQGAVHCKAINEDTHCIMHSFYWPNTHHKRWRFQVSEWSFHRTLGEPWTMTDEEREAIMRQIEKHAVKPRWVLEGEEWDAAGRPRGKAQDKFLREFDKRHPKGGSV